MRYVWWQEDKDSNTWRPSCERRDDLYLFEFNEGGPRANKFSYCPYCGRPLIEMRKARDES